MRIKGRQLEAGSVTETVELTKPIDIYGTNGKDDTTAASPLAVQESHPGQTVVPVAEI